MALVIPPSSAGASAPVVTATGHTAVAATVPDAPPAAARLEAGSVITGTVLGRDAQGLVNIRTDKGVLALQTNANLPAGGSVTLRATVEGGVVYSAFTGPTSYAYLDLLVGATYERVSARVHYSPSYYGRGADAVYAEVAAAYRVREHVQVSAHVGGLWTNARDAYGGTVDPVFDARIGFVFDFDRFNVQLSWVGISNANLGYGLTGVRSRNGPVASVSWLF